MLKSCLAWIGLYILAAVALSVWFFVAYPDAPPDGSPRLPPDPIRASNAAGAALLCAVPAFLAIAGLAGIRTRLRERAQLFAAVRGQEPVDGTTQPFVGRLVARGETLTAPLSGRPCVLYHYQASHKSSGRGASQVTDAEGYALCPVVIDTAAGRFEIRAYLEPEFGPDPIEEDPARARLRAFQRTATLFQPDLNLARNYRESQSFLLDDDGSVRYDHGTQDSARESTRFEEHVVQDGDDVAVIGTYSAARNAVVPDPASEVLHRARVRKGPVAQLARRFAWEAFASGLTGVLFLAATIALVRLFFDGTLSFV
jgi:hypothetical protein